MLRILPYLRCLCSLLPADSDPVVVHRISIGASSAEGGTEWVSSGEGLSLGSKQTSMRGKEKLLTLIRAHESLNLPCVYLVASLIPLAKPERKMKRVLCIRDHLVTASHREGYSSFVFAAMLSTLFGQVVPWEGMAEWKLKNSVMKDLCERLWAGALWPSCSWILTIPI